MTQGDKAVNGEPAKERILKAARKTFAKHSFKAASTRMIAKEAGVDHPLIHYYFGSKVSLFETVAEHMSEETHAAQLQWLEGLERERPREGLGLYLDRLLHYHFENPEVFEVMLQNMAQAGNTSELPGHQYLTSEIERTRNTLIEKLPLKGSQQNIDKFIYCFTQLCISLIGGRQNQALLLEMDPMDMEYKAWVKDALMTIFAPWIERLIFPDTSI